MGAARPEMAEGPSVLPFLPNVSGLRVMHYQDMSRGELTVIVRQVERPDRTLRLDVLEVPGYVADHLCATFGLAASAG